MSKAVEYALLRQREITEAAKSENRDLTEAEMREFDTLTGMIEALADETAQTRSAEKEEKKDTGKKDKKDTEDAEDKQDKKDAGKRTITAQDAAEISNMCRQFGMDAGEFLARGLTPQAASREIIQRHMMKVPPIASRISVKDDEGDKLKRAMIDGLLLRGGGSVKDPAPGANSYRGMSIRELTAECLERENSGKDYRHMGAEELMGAATRAFYNPESVFPQIMDEVVQKSYIEGLEKANVTFDKWVKFGTLPNFKKTNNHEYITECRPKEFTMTRKAFIDDDIVPITTSPRKSAQSSSNIQNKLIYSILMGNKSTLDGRVLFSDDRKNTLAKGMSPTTEVISKMIYMIDIQKDEKGNHLAFKPDIFIVPFGIGVEIKKILTMPTIHGTEGIFANPYLDSRFEVIEDVTLNSFVKEGDPIPWFMGVRGEIIQVDRINDPKGFKIWHGDMAGKLGFAWEIYHDFAVSMLHPQAICRNPGVPFDKIGFGECL